MTQTPITYATMQQLRSSIAGEYPLNLEPGQIAFNMATANYDVAKGIYNIYMFVGNGTDVRIDDEGTAITALGDPGKGWIRYSLAGTLTEGGDIYGNLTVEDGILEDTATAPSTAQLVVPTLDISPVTSDKSGSVRWNTSSNILQAWNGAKWDTTSKVSIGTNPPSNPSNGDLWLDTTDASAPTLLVYVVPSSGPAEWKVTSGPGGVTALQPGNGVSANAQNQIDLINPGDY